MEGEGQSQARRIQDNAGQTSRRLSPSAGEQTLPSRRRDRFLQLLHRRPSRSPSAHPLPADALPPLQAASAGSPQQPSARDHAEVVFLRDALLFLSPSEQAIIKSHRLGVSDRISKVLEDSYVAAQGKMQLCKDKRWKWNIQGRQINLSEQADKVISFLDRLKGIGDIAVNADPIHAGLPWAGIRLILTVAVSEVDHMRSLLIGMESALQMIQRLKLYVEFFSRLPASDAKNGFQEALTRFHATILKFLAKAIPALSHNTFSRACRAFIDQGSSEKFESECRALASQTDIDAQICERNLSMQARLDCSDAFTHLTGSLESLDADLGEIKDTIDELNEATIIQQLPNAKGAAFDSQAQSDGAQCHPKTRVELLELVEAWANDDETCKPMFWLNGVAGIGKSTISRTVAERFKRQKRLAASFFFQRGEEDRGTSTKFFTTLARQLIKNCNVPEIKQQILRAAQESPSIDDSTLEDQFEKLILNPLSKAYVSTAEPVPSLFIVVDALDECEDRRDEIRRILRLFRQLGSQGRKPTLRLFLTSRPDLPILEGFNTIENELHQDIALHKIQGPTVRRDIAYFFEDQFDKIRANFDVAPLGDRLPPDWPGKDCIQKLTEQADPLFIVASTICRFIQTPYKDPREALGSVLQSQRSTASRYGQIYVPVLEQLLRGCITKKDQRDVVELFQKLVGSIVVFLAALSRDSIVQLLGLSLGQARILRVLTAVIEVPEDPKLPIRMYHLSFRDFLVDQETKDETVFWIDEKATHGLIANQCLELLAQPGRLRRDILSIKKLGVHRTDVEEARIDAAFPGAVSYACLYWVSHLVESEARFAAEGAVYDFFKSHFLHWLEALAWFGKLTSAIDRIVALQSLLKLSTDWRLQAFLAEARRFVLQNRAVIDTLPLQIYGSALTFLPTTSIIREMFRNEFPLQVRVNGPMLSVWGSDLLQLEGHDDSVTSLSFSPDGKLLASASKDATIRIWGNSSGEQVHKLQDDRDIKAVIFSPDGTLLASASGACISLWDPLSGMGLKRLSGHEECVTALAFFPVDSKLLASGAYDGTVRLWNISTGQNFRTLDVDQCHISKVSFSADGCWLASASNKELAVWKGDTGHLALKRQDYKNFDRVVPFDFSPDLKLLAVSQKDRIELWNIQTWQLVRKMHERDGYPWTLSFSPRTGGLLASSSYAGISLWETSTGQRTRVVQTDDLVRRLAFSPNAEALASASLDRILLWNVSTGERIQKFPGNTSHIEALSFSPDGEVFASATRDGTVCVSLASVDKGQVEDLADFEGMAWDLKFSPDKTLLASGSLEGLAQLWDASTGLRLRALKNDPESPLSSISFSWFGEHLAFIKDNTVRIWDISAGKQVQELKLDVNDAVVTIEFSPNGQVLLSLCLSFTVRIWDVSTGQQLLEVPLDGNWSPGLEDWERTWLRALAFSADSGLVATANSPAVEVWKLPAGEKTQTLQAQEGHITTIAFSYDNRLLAAGIKDGRVRIWTLSTEEQARDFQGHDDIVEEVSFSPNGHFLASAANDRKVRLWNTTTGEQVQCLEALTVPRRVRFLADNTQLETNIGYLDTGLVTQSQQAPGHRLQLQGRWIKFRNENLLALPHSCQVFRSAACEGKLALGHPSGSITLIHEVDEASEDVTH